MADLSVTPGSVAWVAGTISRANNAGATITAGQVVYLAANNLWLLAQCDGTAIEAGSGVIFGFALHPSALNQPLAVQIDGTINPGGTVVVGEIYVVSVTAGGIGVFSELVSTNKITFLGIGLTATTISMAIKGNTGVAKV